MSIGSPFPTKNKTFSLSNPSVTQTLWNEIARTVMSTQRGVGSEVGDLSEAWNSKQSNIRDIIKNRMSVDMGSFDLPTTGLPSSYASRVEHVETVTFASNIFAGYQPQDVRIFCPMMYQPPYDDGNNYQAHSFQSCVGNIQSTGTVGVDMVVTGFDWVSKALWPDISGRARTVYWCAVAGGNDGAGANGSVAHFPTEGWDYW